MASELPYETYQRLTGKQWISGKSADIRALLTEFGIKAPAGSEQANMELQRALKSADVRRRADAPAPRIPEAAPKKPGDIPDLRSPIDKGYAEMSSRPGTSAISQFSPQDFKRITSALDTAATVYGSGAGLGVAGAALAAGSGAGLIGETGILATKAIREAMVKNDREAAMAAMKQLSSAALKLTGRARTQAMQQAADIYSNLTKAWSK